MDYPMMTDTTTEPASLDGWLAVKENLFKPEPQNVKIRPNIHVCWNAIEMKFCITFNEHSRVKTDTEQRCSFSGFFDLDDLKNLRSEFSYLCGPELDERYFPEAAFTDSIQNGINSSTTTWLLSYLFGPSFKNSSPEIMDKLCIPLEDYLSEAYRRSSHFTFLSVLYPDDFQLDQYFENLSELRHKNYLERMEKSKRNLEGLLKTRDEQRRLLILGKNQKFIKRRNSVDKPIQSSSNDGSSTFEPAVTDLEAAYCEQLRAAVLDLLETIGEYFTYLKQPFLDMRELAAEKIRHAKRAMKSADYGDRVKTKLAERLPYWQQEHGDSVENLRDLQLQYFEECKRALTDYRDALVKETRPPRRSDYFTTAPFKDQLLDAERRLAFDNVNYWSTVIQHVKAERKRIIAQVGKIDLTASNIDELVHRFEEQLFRKQAKYVEASVQLLQEKDQYLKLQLREIRQKAVLSPESGDQDGEDVFYDAVESELELQRFLEMYSSSQPKIYQLKTELEAVNRQKAALRNKKKKLESLKRNGNLLTSMAVSEQSPELRNVVEVEQRRQAQLRDDRVRHQRTMTLQRIKDYRTKNPALSRTSSKQSISASTTSINSSGTSVRPYLKKKSVAPAATNANCKIRNGTTATPEAKDDLWSITPAASSAKEFATMAVNGTSSASKSNIPPAPPPMPVPNGNIPPAPPPMPAPTGNIPPAPPLPPPAPSGNIPPPPALMPQAPTSFFVPLEKKPIPKKAAPPGNAPMDSILHAIKNGVQLKRVDASELEEQKRKPILNRNKGGQPDVHSTLLKELMARMSKAHLVSSDSESESEDASVRNGDVDDDEFDD